MNLEEVKKLRKCHAELGSASDRINDQTLKSLDPELNSGPGSG
jgi:hypothetical protein